MKDDAISRSAALDIVLHVLPLVKRSTYARLIGLLPSLDAQPVVHASWTAEDARGGRAFRFRCSSCMCDVWYGYLVRSCDYNYCPNCGARMDGDPHDGSGQ